MKVYLTLLISLGVSSCVSVPKPQIVLPECKPKEIIVKKECPIPKKLSPIPEKMYIEIDGEENIIDKNGEKFIRDYVDMQLWIKEHY